MIVDMRQDKLTPFFNFLRLFNVFDQRDNAGLETSFVTGGYFVRSHDSGHCHEHALVTKLL